MFPKPPWFVTHRRAHHVVPRLLRFEAEQRLIDVPGIIIDALRG
jgi:aldehyde dehydrogenase (NAD(P)+)